jgi:hypothetical protein
VRRAGVKKGEAELLLPSIQQFSAAGSSEEFRDVVGDQNGKVISELARLLSSHFIHPQVFIDIEGKREWEASDLGHKLITLHAERGDKVRQEDEEEEEKEEEGTRTIDGMCQLLMFLWAAASQAMWKPSDPQGDPGRGDSDVPLQEKSPHHDGQWTISNPSRTNCCDPRGGPSWRARDSLRQWW